MNTQKFKNADLFIKQIIEKTSSDSSFKKRLIDSPKLGIEELIGREFEIPISYKILVEDQSNSDTIYLNIPRMPKTSDFELSEEELEKVSGGVVSILGADCAVVAAVVGTIVAVSQALEWLGDGWNNYKPKNS